MRNGQLSDQDHEEMDNFLRHILSLHARGDMDQVTAVSTMANVIAYIDNHDYETARLWFKDHKRLLAMAGP